jgi:hypothetical protein
MQVPGAGGARVPPTPFRYPHPHSTIEKTVNGSFLMATGSFEEKEDAQT